MSPDADIYVAAVLAIIISTMVGIDPDKGTLHKWIYWAIAPILVVGLFALAFNSLVAGLGMAVPALALLIVGYFRFHV